MGKLEITLQLSDSCKELLESCTRLVERFEALQEPKQSQAAKPDDQVCEEEELIAPVTKTETKKVDSFNEEEDTPEEVSPPSKEKKAKTRKVTVDDVNDACKARARLHSRDAVLEILQKNFNTKTISSLNPDQYALCVELMSAN